MRAAAFLQGLVALLIVALGQPSFSPLLAPVAAVCGYALFWKAIARFPSKHQRFWKGWIWYAAVSMVQLSWMTAIEYQGIYILFVWVAVSIGVGFQFGLLSTLIPYNQKLTAARAGAIAAVWTLFEWSRYHFLCGYSWNVVGLALSDPIAMQCAALFGILGLSFWVMLVNLFGLRALSRGGRACYALWALLAAVPYLFGCIHLGYHKKRMAACSERYRCVLVQTGVLPPEKVPIQGSTSAFISPYEQWKKILSYVSLFRDSSVDLVVLPEAAVPFSLNVELYDPERVRKIFIETLGQLDESVFPPLSGDSRVSNAYLVQALANAFESDVIVGLDYTDPNGLSYNSAFFARPHQLLFERYDKRILMPLAEYLPFRWLSPLVKAYGITGFFTPGKSARLFESRLPLAASICYEETFPAKVREGRLLGAQLLVNITNDGWYPFSKLTSQHFEHARFRSVENGVPLVRSCNTGVTAAIDSLGRTLEKLEESNGCRNLQRGAVLVQIIPYTYFTLFAMWGNGGIVCVCLLLLGIFFALRRTLKW